MFDNRIKQPSKNIIGYLFLLVVIISGASFVPLGVNLDVSNPLMKVSWRVMNMLPFLLVGGVLQAKRSRFFKMNSFLEKETLLNIVIASFCIAMQQCSVITAGKYTLMSHCVIFVNLTGPVIVSYRMIRRQYVHKLEIIGCSVAIFGSFVSVMDKSAEKTNTEDQNIWLGDLIAFLGSFLNAVWMVKNEEIVQKLPPLYAMFYIMLFCELFLLIAGCILFSDFTLGFDPITGALGFLHPGMWFFVIFIYGFFTGACN